jgi:hypothetical protein
MKETASDQRPDNAAQYAAYAVADGSEGNFETRDCATFSNLLNVGKSEYRIFVRHS